MRKHLIYTLFLAFSFSCSIAQTSRELNNPLTDSRELLKKGVTFHEKGQYKDAIAEFLKVPASDTNYADVLHELIYSYYSDSNYAAAEKYLAVAFDLFPEKNYDWYSFAANIYDDTKRSEQAIQAYDSILKQDPYNYLAYFNKGISYFRIAKYDEAEKYFKQCVIINPYYSSGHHYLGRISLLKGNLTQAMMSFAANLFISPENRHQTNSVHYLNSIAEVNDDINELLKKYKPSSQDNFDEIQEIITSKISLDKKYKLKTDLEDPIVRQLQVLLEKLEFNEVDKGFWMQYYVPLYKQLWDKKLFEPMVNYMFSGLDIKKVKEYNQKEKKKIENLSTEIVTYLNGIRESQEVVFSKRENAKPRYYIKDYRVTGTGNYGRNSKNEFILDGKWKFYYENGGLKSTGSFDGEGNKKGEWQYFFENGKLKEVSYFTDNKAQGKSDVWYDNGLKYQHANYLNDKLDGEETTYYYNGLLRSVVHYREGKREGNAKYYNVNGCLTSQYSYADDKAEGMGTSFYPDGKIQWKLNYTKDNPVGIYKEYHENGQLKVSGEYSEKGEKNGLWKYYYEDGKPEYIQNYTNGDLDGEYISYYENGKIESKRFYKKGDIDDKKEDFDDDGKLFSESVFERGRLRDIKFFDKKGQVISSTSSRKGNANITFYDADGSKSNEGYYSKEGVLEGRGVYYYKNGKISMDGLYKNGYLDGKKLTYFENGKISQEGFYKENKAEGYFVNYHLNGQVSDEGWYVDDDRQGTFIDHDLMGNVTGRVYYLNDKVHGISEYYFPNGKLNCKEYYDNGWFTKMDQFDTSGKLLSRSVLDKGEGKVIFRHFNGKLYFENTYKNYKLNGAHISMNGDGSKRVLCYYKNGELDSVYTAWYPNGKVEAEGTYKDGDKNGLWKYYYVTGQLSEVENYKDGKLEGSDIQYQEDNSVDKEMFFKKGKLDSTYRIYGDNKQLAVQFNYKDNVLISYTYENKDGKLVDPVELNRGSGKVVAYYKNGNKSLEMDFNESSVDGVRNIYFTNGKIFVSSTRVTGYENGNKKIYYPSGKILKDENYYFGKHHGTQKYYNENGTLVYELNYYLGELHGECKYYTAGKLSATYIYYYDQLESKK